MLVLNLHNPSRFLQVRFGHPSAQEEHTVTPEIPEVLHASRAQHRFKDESELNCKETHGKEGETQNSIRRLETGFKWKNHRICEPHREGP